MLENKNMTKSYLNEYAQVEEIFSLQGDVLVLITINHVQNTLYLYLDII